ncbi:hypothetical protein [Peribacillus butanolivorans]|uniref:hypothetical protein n=1 Tax=Peribacillus butanolivorans TaxID=421767 RepID=UPI0036DDD6F2
MKELIFDGITVITAILNVIFVFLVYKLTQKDINPKLYVSTSIEDAKNKYDKGVNAEVDNIDFNKKGFPEIGHDTQLWQLKVFNNGDLPATNVIVEYSITIKKAEFEYGIDKADVINERFLDFKTINKTIKFDYIAPHSEKIEKILYLKGDFPYADLKISTLISKERKFIENPILLQTYEHPEFLVLEDSHHARQMIGAYKED